MNWLLTKAERGYYVTRNVPGQLNAFSTSKEALAFLKEEIDKMEARLAPPKPPKVVKVKKGKKP